MVRVRDRFWGVVKVKVEVGAMVMVMVLFLVSVWFEIVIVLINNSKGKTMAINQELMELILKELLSKKNDNQNQSSEFGYIRKGVKVLIRTVTHYYTGKIEEVSDKEILLSTAAWIADTGRFSDALKKGISVLKEIEPIPSGVVINRGAIVDVCLWPHELPTVQK